VEGLRLWSGLLAEPEPKGGGMAVGVAWRGGDRSFQQVSGIFGAIQGSYLRQGGNKLPRLARQQSIKT